MLRDASKEINFFFFSSSRRCIFLRIFFFFFMKFLQRFVVAPSELNAKEDRRFALHTVFLFSSNTSRSHFRRPSAWRRGIFNMKIYASVESQTQ